MTRTIEQDQNYSGFTAFIVGLSVACTSTVSAGGHTRLTSNQTQLTRVLQSQESTRIFEITTESSIKDMNFFSKQCLSYSPMINASGNSIGTRICARQPMDQDHSIALTYETMSTFWPAELGPLLLDIGDFNVDSQLLDVDSNDQLHLEIPSALTQTPEGCEWILELQNRGFLLAMRGIPAKELSPQVAAAFKFATIDVAHDRRIAKDFEAHPAAMSKRRMDTIITGISTIDQMERCFASGAGSIVGWPVEDAMQRAAPAKVSSSVSTISQLIQLIDEDADPKDMRKVFASDPAIAYRLFGFLNSAAFGLKTEIRSFEHAIMILGHKPLRKWLALLLTTASSENRAKPIIYGSIRRGLLLENILSVDTDPETRESGFILGVFSMLDKLFAQPFEEVFEQVYVSDAVYEALVHNTGPAIPYLNLMRAIETCPDQVHQARENAFVSGTHCNNSLLGALREARSLNMAS